MLKCTNRFALITPSHISFSLERELEYKFTFVYMLWYLVFWFIILISISIQIWKVYVHISNWKGSSSVLAISRYFYCQKLTTNNRFLLTSFSLPAFCPPSLHFVLWCCFLGLKPLFGQNVNILLPLDFPQCTLPKFVLDFF